MCTVEYFFNFNDAPATFVLLVQEFESNDIRKLDYLISQVKWFSIDRKFKYSLMYHMSLNSVDEYIKMNDEIKNMLIKIEFSDFYE